MIQRNVKISNKLGLHARPAAEFVEKANTFKSRISVEKDGKKVNAKSIIEILTLGAKYGCSIKITAEGEDEAEAVEALAKLLS